MIATKQHISMEGNPINGSSSNKKIRELQKLGTNFNELFAKAYELKANPEDSEYQETKTELWNIKHKIDVILGG